MAVIAAQQTSGKVVIRNVGLMLSGDIDRPILDAEGKKLWELLICASPDPQRTAVDEGGDPSFRWMRICPAGSVNSVWLRQALEAALQEAGEAGLAPPRRLRCWRGSMRTMVQRAAEGLGMELVPSRRCYSLVEWLQQREAEVYPQQPGYMAGPLAPPPLLSLTPNPG